MIPFLDLQRINAPFIEAYHAQLQKVVEKGWFILGDQLKQFETDFAATCRAPYAIGVANGLDAITLLFKAHIALGKLQPGDHILVQANTYIASIMGIIEAGLQPILIEPDAETFNLSPEKIIEAITPEIKGVLVVHLYGQLAPMREINAIAAAQDWVVIEDAAQAHGLTFEGMNDLAFSFYPGKNLGALGDGGAVVTHNSAVAKMVQTLRNYGSSQKYHNELRGMNSRLDELQAAFLNVRLPHLMNENNLRRKWAQRYLTEIQNSAIQLPNVMAMDAHVFHLFVIQTPYRKQLQSYLLQNGIETMIHYPIPPHKQGAFSNWNTLSFPITEQIHDTVLSLPMSPVLSEESCTFIIQTLNQFQP